MRYHENTASRITKSQQLTQIAITKSQLCSEYLAIFSSVNIRNCEITFSHAEWRQTVVFKQDPLSGWTVGKPSPKVVELQRIVRAMRDRRITQKFIAKDSGVGQSVVSNLLRGKLRRWSDNLQKLWEYVSPTAGHGPENQLQADNRGERNDDRRSTRGRSTSSRFFRVKVTTSNVVEIPGEAQTVIDWLTSANDHTIDCLAVVTPEGLRRIVPLSEGTQQKFINLESSFETSPATVNEFGTQRIRLDRYLAEAWEVRVVGVASGDYEVHITSPDDVIPRDTNVQAYARPPDVLEIVGLPEDATELMGELKRVAAEFPTLLDRLSGN